MELKIYIRHTQFTAFETDVSGTTGLVQGDNIIFVGANTSTLHPVKGDVPMQEWKDITDSVADLDKINITWTAERDANGNSTANGINQKKSASGSLKIEGEGYFIIKDWLIDHVSAPLNSIDVKIEHVECGMYKDFAIKSPQIQWCEDGICEFDITLQQRDEAYHCIQKTIINDNWQGWFQDVPANGKKHPRFVYCNEARPSFIMITLWWISTLIFSFMVALTPIIEVIIAIVGVIKTIIDVIKWLIGKRNVNFKDNFNWFDPGAVMKSFYTESSGCGFMHPAPLIRDYIYNVCKKCNVEVDNISAPIFFSEFINIDTSAERLDGVKKRENPYYNSCYMSEAPHRGIRMYSHLFGKGTNGNQYWKEANAPVAMSLDMFLDEIKGVYNSDWHIAMSNGKPTLFFWRKDWFVNGKLLYDFTSDKDRLKILEGMCFSWNEVRMPSYIKGLYNTDSIDSCGNEAKTFMNDYISVNTKTNNINFDSELDKTAVGLGATRFRLDGVDKDYLSDALQVVYNGAGFTPTIPSFMESVIIPTVTRFDYALMLSQDTTSLAKILIWDGVDMEYARAIRSKKAHIQGDSSLPMPTPNIYYNPQQKRWDELHEIITDVTGMKLSTGSETPGNYQVKRTPFKSVAYGRAALLVNYPMYFSSKFKDNLYDWFHWIDDPTVNPKLNMNWRCKIEMCCDDLIKLGLFGDSSDVKLLNRVKVPNVHYSDGIITEITVDYDSENTLGKTIELKGTM